MILFLTAISFTASAQNEVTCDTRVTFSNPVTQSEVNTLYIGANHKISIKAAGVAPANLVIKLSKGVIEGNNGSYIARVFSVGEALIQVYSNENGAEKKLAEKTLQTRVIPRPGSEEFKEVVKSLGPKVIGQ